MRRSGLVVSLLLLVPLMAGVARGQRHPGDSNRLPCAAQPNQKAIDLDARRDYRGCRFPGSLDRQERTARSFLQEFAGPLGMAEDLTDLETLSTRRGLVSAHTRLGQRHLGIPIFSAELSVHQGRDGSVTAFHTNYQVRPEAGPIRARVVRRGAIARAEAAILMQRRRLPPKHRRVWFAGRGQVLRIAHEVWIYAAEPLGDFLMVVDGETGKILFQENRMAFATGEALIFWPNAMQTSGNTGLQDNSDATTSLLDAERVRVTLEGLDSGTGRLKGEYVDVTFGGGKTWTVADEADRIYEYDRDDERFEEALVYHTVDQLQRYFHELGFDDHEGVANGIRDFPTLANPHWDEDDNSFYSTGDDAIHFGDGGVDDAEDADVIAHELGHAIQHDQNTCWGGGDMGAMGEGFGDYLAASFYADIGDPTYQANHAACVAEWDATSYSGDSPPCLRRVDGTKVYPDDLVGEVHDDGEIWARLLWDIRIATDGPTADRIVLEHHFAVPCDATMVDAASALVQADADLNGGANAGVIRGAACDRGIFTGSQCGGLSLTLAASPVPAVSGEALTYTLTIRNDDGETATAVVAVGVVPAGTSYVSASASDGGNESGGTISWPAFDLVPGASVQRSFIVTVLAPGGGGVLFADDMEVGGARWVVSHGAGTVDWALSGANPFGGTGRSSKVPVTEVGATNCTDGKAGVFSCHEIDLEYFYPMSSIGGGEGTDGWGWTDPATQNEYVLMGRSSGTAFVDASVPSAPVYLGNLPTHTTSSDWRDIKVYANHAFIVSEAGGHGLQIFDLTQLRSVASPPATFTETAHMSSFGSAHNIVINEETGFAYIVGADVCSGGLYIVDISDPASPAYAGCYDGDGYTHDAQCVAYSGPDADYAGREICFAFNEDTLTIVDVTDKNSIVQISRSTYSGSAYTHQGWLARNQRYLLLDDESDEQSSGHNTRTYIVDVEDLDAPVFVGSHTGSLPAIDHNLYTDGDFAYQANYTAGLRILELTDLASADLCEVASFDVYPDSDAATFNGAWNVYPYFKSGLVAVMTIEGLALVRPDLSSPTCVGSGEGSGQSWFAADVGEISDQYLEMDGQILLPAGAELRFWHSYDFEDGYDGGVVEIALDGAGWIDLGSKFIDNGYGSEISTGYQNPIGGRSGFSGRSGSYLLSVVDLSDYEGQTARIRFRAGTDSSVAGQGWYIDDVSLSSGFILQASASVASAGSATISASAATSIIGDGGEAVCGDGVLGFGELCDAAGESITCDDDCTPAVCGDGHTNAAAGEECDTAGGSAGCDTDCTLPVCGDGVLNVAAGEACDDGNVADFDGCSSLCATEPPLSLSEHQCLRQNAIWTAKIAVTQFRENQSCTRDGSKGRLGGVSLAACPVADRRGRMLKLEVKFGEMQARKCTSEPSFGFVAAAGMMDALGSEGAASIESVFGNDPAGALIDATVPANKPASVCQLTTQKFADKVALTMLKEFTSCVKRVAADRNDPIASLARLESCIDEISMDSRQKVARAVDKLAFQIAKRCLATGVDLGQIGGTCAVGADASVVASCLETKMACNVCEMASGAFALGTDCDAFDDGVSNASCGGTP